MRRRIVVEQGEVTAIARLMGCTTVFVSYALNFRRDSELARRIRRMALLRGGIEIGNEPVKGGTSNEGKTMEAAVR